MVLNPGLYLSSRTIQSWGMLFMYTLEKGNALGEE